MGSLERLYRANPYENTKLFNTLRSRVDTLAQSSGGLLFWPESVTPVSRPSNNETVDPLP